METDCIIHNSLKHGLLPFTSRGNRTPGSSCYPVRTPVVQAKYCSSFQLTHMPHGNHTHSNAGNGGQREDKKLLQHSATAHASMMSFGM